MSECRASDPTNGIAFEECAAIRTPPKRVTFERAWFCFGSSSRRVSRGQRHDPARARARLESILRDDQVAIHVELGHVVEFPFSGTVSRKLVVDQATLEAGDPLDRIADLSTGTTGRGSHAARPPTVPAAPHWLER